MRLLATLTGGLLGAFPGLLLVVVVGLLTAGGDAGDCRAVYGLLGATDRAEILGLPDDLSASEIQTLEERLAQFEEQSPNDPVCDRLREDLEAQR